MNELSKQAVMSAFPELVLISKLPLPIKFKRQLIALNILKYYPQKVTLTYENIKDILALSTQHETSEGVIT